MEQALEWIQSLGSLEGSTKYHESCSILYFSSSSLDLSASIKGEEGREEDRERRERFGRRERSSATTLATPFT